MIYFVIPLLTLGLLLLGLEIFVPGFGIPGFIGVLSIIASALLTILYIPFGSFIVVGEVAFISISLWTLIKWAKSKQMYGNLILKDILKQEPKEIDNNEKLIGKQGVTVVPLKPFGCVEFNGIKMDAYSEGLFIPKGRTVSVINVENDRIIVREMN